MWTFWSEEIYLTGFPHPNVLLVNERRKSQQNLIASSLIYAFKHIKKFNFSWKLTASTFFFLNQWRQTKGELHFPQNNRCVLDLVKLLEMKESIYLIVCEKQLLLVASCLLDVYVCPEGTRLLLPQRRRFTGFSFRLLILSDGASLSLLLKPHGEQC